MNYEDVYSYCPDLILETIILHIQRKRSRRRFLTILKLYCDYQSWIKSFQNNMISYKSTKRFNKWRRNMYTSKYINIIFSLWLLIIVDWKTKIIINIILKRIESPIKIRQKILNNLDLINKYFTLIPKNFIKSYYLKWPSKII